MKEARVKRLRTAMKEASKKRHMSHHNIAVLGKCRARKAFGKGISNHEMRAKRYKLHDAAKIKFATIMNTHIDVAGGFSAHRVSRHGNTGQIVLINVSRGELRETHIMQKSAEILNLFTHLTSSHILSLRRRESNGVLSTGLPGNRPTI